MTNEQFMKMEDTMAEASVNLETAALLLEDFISEYFEEIDAPENLLLACKCRYSHLSARLNAVLHLFRDGRDLLAQVEDLIPAPTCAAEAPAKVRKVS